ncbi:hypothetical protein HQ590_16080 [bacterium]|nr:hypothetical protein [bacterium]
MRARLVALLREQEDAICYAWTQRLADAAQLASRKLAAGPVSPVHQLVRDLVDALEGRLTDLEPESIEAARQRLGPVLEWRINLCQAVEVLLTGEVVVRFWVRAHLDVDATEQLELFEEINRAFHELLRLYTLRYCDHCHARLTVGPGTGAGAGT